MITKVKGLSHEFRGIAKDGSKVIFISNALPDEVVDINIIKENKKIKEGKVVSYITKSSNRIEPICPYYNKCGGCNLSHINYQKSLEYKKEIVKNILKRYSNLEINPTIISNNNEYYYRNKISLKIKNNHLALVRHNSNELIEIDNCLLVNKNINKIINILNKQNLEEINSITIRGEEELMVIVNGRIDNKFIDSLKNNVKSIVLNGKVVYGKEYIKITVKDIIYAIYPDSFFQVNTKMIPNLYDKILEYAGNNIEDSLLDLYCGAGTISIYLSKYFKKVRGIEVNKDAIRGANLNKKINKVSNTNFECHLSSQIDKIEEDIVVVDPPRNGLDKITIQKLKESNVKKIIYVSCSPITLARDLNILKEKYDLNDITLLDLFPNTNHVECVSLLCLK